MVTISIVLFAHQCNITRQFPSIVFEFCSSHQQLLASDMTAHLLSDSVILKRQTVRIVEWLVSGTIY
jgi:hypothetical protein